VGVNVEAHKAAIGRFFDDKGSAISRQVFEVRNVIESCVLRDAAGMMRQFGATG
jgi:hypothetical protein